MATKTVAYKDDPYLTPGHTRATPPVAKPGGWAPGDTLVFDRALAEQHNRVCACHGDGECFAYLFAADQSLACDPTRKTEPFTVLEETADEAPTDDTPADDKPATKPTTRRKTAATE